MGGGQYTSTAVFNNVTSAYAGTWIAVATDANGCTSDTAKYNGSYQFHYLPDRNDLFYGNKYLCRYPGHLLQP